MVELHSNPLDVAEKREQGTARQQTWLVDRVLAARRGDASAFEDLVLEFAPKVYRFALCLVHDEEVARDVLQETLFVAWKDLSQLRRAESFWPWLGGIALRQARTATRRRPALVHSPNLGRAVDPGPGDIVEFTSAFERLPTRHQEVLALRYIVGLSESETARVLRVRVGTVKSRTARARASLAGAIGHVMDTA